MSIQQFKSRLNLNKKWLKPFAVSTLALVGLLGFAHQAMAHHASGGKTPDSILTGLLAGLAHPVIGLDHLAFVVASGLSAAVVAGGVFIPVAFVLATIAGTVVHIMEISLPIPEIAIAASVVLFGGLLAIRHNVSRMALAAIAAVAGLFHGYAYGEAIVGAEMSPLFAYLVGFALIQLLIALGAYMGGQLILKRPLMMRYLGLAIAAIGFVFLTRAMG